MLVYVCVYVNVCVGCISDLIAQSEFGNKRRGPNLDLCSQSADMLGDLTHEMLQRSVPVRVVQTRRQFGPGTASFHVSVCFCVITYLPLSMVVV